jgi:hypothetical protein
MDCPAAPTRVVRQDSANQRSTARNGWSVRSITSCAESPPRKFGAAIQPVFQGGITSSNPFGAARGIRPRWFADMGRAHVGPWSLLLPRHRPVGRPESLRRPCDLTVVRPEGNGGVRVCVTGRQVDQVGADTVLAEVSRAELLDDRVVVGDASVLEQRPSVGVGQEVPCAFRRMCARAP